MRFFTDNCFGNQLQWPWMLCRIDQYFEIKEYSQWREILIDPGVYELTKADHYSWEGDLNIIEFLEALPENHYFSADYPSDMNLKYENSFIQKSWKNAKKYHNYPQYITTVQGKFNNYFNYIDWFHKYNDLDPEFLGLGNICQHRTWNSFMKHTLPYIFKYAYANRIHIYGLCKDAIPKVFKLSKKYNKEISIDQEKWQFYKKSNHRPQDFKAYLIDLIDLEVEFEI